MRLTATAAAKPASATNHPAIRTWRRPTGSISAASATANPAVTQTGGRPGPPGLSSSRSRAGNPPSDNPVRWMPASRRKPPGARRRAKDQGMRISSGATATTSASSTETAGAVTAGQRRETRDQPAQATAMTAASGHSSGTNAAPTATPSPVPHAARRATAGLAGRAVTIRAAARPMSGSRANATAVPSRPAAMAPVATGSSAYDAAPMIRAATDAVTRRAAR
jgi:hypothetical protein